MSAEKYRIVEKLGEGISQTLATGTLLGCKQYILKMVDEDYKRIITMEPNPLYKPKLRPYQQKAIDDLRESFREPQLIQGYTAEQWQDIIDGGYLCEFSDRYDIWWPGFLYDIPTETNGLMASSLNKENAGKFNSCRPAQIKGVMRPIFVEPVDPDSASCVFFGQHGTPLHSNVRWGYELGVSKSKATKYIEL